MKVKNLHGDHSITCGCKSWLRHWENNSSMEATFCSKLNCYHPAEFGGHVIKVNSDDRNWYIVPICPTCNSLYEKEYDLKADTILVPVEKTDLCGQ